VQRRNLLAAIGGITAGSVISSAANAEDQLSSKLAQNYSGGTEEKFEYEEYHEGEFGPWLHAHHISSVITFHGSVYVPSRSEWHHDFGIQTIIDGRTKIDGDWGSSSTLKEQQLELSSNDDISFGLSTNDEYFGYWPKVPDEYNSASGFPDESDIGAVARQAASTGLSIIANDPRATIGIAAANLAYDLYTTNQDDSEGISPIAPLNEAAMDATYNYSCGLGCTKHASSAAHHLRFFAEQPDHLASDEFSFEVDTHNADWHGRANHVEDWNITGFIEVFPNDTADPRMSSLSSRNPEEMSESGFEKLGISKLTGDRLVPNSNVSVSSRLLRRGNELRRGGEPVYMASDIPIKAKRQQ